MIQLELIPVLITGLTVAVLHASLPTHWLPFVLASRSQKWSYKKTFSILLIAGSGHVFTTTLIGAAVIWFGITFHGWLEQWLVSVAALSVALAGFYNIVQHFRGYHHSHCDHSHPHHHDYKKAAKDGWAILSLLSLLTFSPCESFLPIYVSAWPLGWPGFLWLSAILAAGTLIAMTVFMTIVFYGTQQLKLKWLEDYEKLIIGIILVSLSVMIYLTEIIFPHHH